MLFWKFISFYGILLIIICSIVVLIAGYRKEVLSSKENSDQDLDVEVFCGDCKHFVPISTPFKAVCTHPSNTEETIIKTYIGKCISTKYKKEPRDINLNNDCALWEEIQ